mgnify:CR=1 FL=1
MSTKSFISAADLSAKTGYAVKLNGSLTNGQAQVALAGANETAIGIIKDGGRASGDEVSVVFEGATNEARLGDTVTVGDFLKVDSTGRLVTATATGDINIIAQALKSGAVGELIPVIIVKFVL